MCHYVANQFMKLNAFRYIILDESAIVVKILKKAGLGNHKNIILFQ